MNISQNTKDNIASVRKRLVATDNDERGLVGRDRGYKREGRN